MFLSDGSLASLPSYRTDDAQIRLVLTEFPADTIVEWLVRSPTQEFLIPLDEHAMLTENIPRVSTPEELVSYLSN